MSTRTPAPDAPRRGFSTVFAVAALAWFSLLVVSPYLLTHGEVGSLAFRGGTLVYVAGRTVCHQRGERSFHAWGVPLPVCGRCLGIYAGAVFGSLFAACAAGTRRTAQPVATPDPRGSGSQRPAEARLWRRRLLFAAAPTAASVMLEAAGVWAQTPLVRGVSALPLGGVIAWFVGDNLADVVARLQVAWRV